MGAQEHAHKLFFFLEEGEGVLAFLKIGYAGAYGLKFFALAEKGYGGILHVGAEALAVFDQFVDKVLPAFSNREIGLPVYAHRLKGSGKHKSLQGLAVDKPAHSLHKVPDIRVGAVGLAVGDYRIDNVRAEALHSPKAEADVAPGIYAEVSFRLVYIRNQDLYLVSAAVVHYLLYFLHVGEILAEVGSLEFRRIVGLEPSRLVTHPGVAGGVGLVEGIGSELSPVGPDLVEDFLGMSVLYATLDELVIERLQHVQLLLAHSLAELVGLALRESCHFLGDSHHLFLIDGDPVGLVQELGHHGQVEADFLFTPFPGDERRDVVHGARTVEGVHGDEVLEPLRMQPLQPLLHAGRFELEDALRVSARIKSIGFRVVDGDFLYVDIHSVALFDKRQAFLYDRKRPEPQEIHLQHAHFLDIGAFVLRHPHVLPRGLVLAHGDGDVVGEVATADNHGAGVYARLADASFQLKRIFKDVLYEVGAVFHLVFQLRKVFDAVFQRGLHFLVLSVDLDGERPVGNHLGQAVRFVEAQAAYARYVLYGTFGCHRSEGDDMRDMIDAVFVLYVLDHAVAAVVVEIDVDIRHGDTLWIEESFKEEIVLDGVEIGDPEAIGNRASRGASPSGADGDAVPLGPVDEVLDDKEIIGETHPGDGLQFEVEPLGLLFAEAVAVAGGGAVVRQLAHVRDGVAEFVAPVFAVLVISAFVDDGSVFFVPLVYFVEEVFRKVEFRENVSAVYFVTFNLVEDLDGV